MLVNRLFRDLLWDIQTKKNKTLDVNLEFTCFTGVTNTIFSLCTKNLTDDLLLWQFSEPVPVSEVFTANNRLLIDSERFWTLLKLQTIDCISFCCLVFNVDWCFAVTQRFNDFNCPIFISDVISKTRNSDGSNFLLQIFGIWSSWNFLTFADCLLFRMNALFIA